MIYRQTNTGPLNTPKQHKRSSLTLNCIDNYQLLCCFGLTGIIYADPFSCGNTAFKIEESPCLSACWGAYEHHGIALIIVEIILNCRQGPFCKAGVEIILEATNMLSAWGGESGGCCMGEAGSRRGLSERREVAGEGGIGGLPGQTAELLQGLCSRSGPLHWVL